MAKLLFFVCVGLLKLNYLFKFTEASAYEKVWDAIGLKEDEASEEAKEVLRSITALGSKIRDPSEFEVDLEELKQRLDGIVNKTKNFLEEIDANSYSSFLTDMAISTFRQMLETAPYDSWKKAYQLVKKDTSLLTTAARNKQEFIWTMWKTFIGNTKFLEEGLDTVLEVAEVAKLVEVVVRALREKSKDFKGPEESKPLKSDSLKVSKTPENEPSKYNHTKDSKTTENKPSKSDDLKDSKTARNKPQKSGGVKGPHKIVKKSEAPKKESKSKSGTPKKITAKGKTKQEL